ncbi:YicC/YloC family endoribonuclease [Dongia rigui]|uniref:YicC/YloC family endoribonuclease n=1 Tax=Dongia rigui TaxID=940149 RepID=A0ABU5DUZ5_9PROT|nr:YicC/YloC family endoribonuclease [Dongia rigui]MDY0870754.1 YicC/YloC family endoribonuclease [Dongia rigui]
MTGFARTSGAVGDFLWTWELKSVNGRSLDVRCRVPQGFEAMDGIVRQAAAEYLKRGNLSANLTVDDVASRGRLSVNRAALDQILALVGEMQGRVEARPPSLDGLLGLKGVLELETPPVDAETLARRQQAIEAGLKQAMTELGAMRRVEGKRLADVVGGHLDEVERLRVAAVDTAGAQPINIRRRLEEQLRDLMPDGIPVDPERLAQELALVAGRADVREEIDRLAAHVAAARDLIKKGGAVGRKMDFLCQEFNREANTLCSKAADLALTNLGIELKAAIEQLREQIQNIE